MASSIEQLLSEARSVITRLTPRETLAAQAAGALVLDTRSAGDRRNRGWIPGSVPIDRTVLEWRADPASEFRDDVVCGASQLIVVCSEGFSSSLAAANLVRLGHQTAADLEGGYRAWVAAGLPVEWPGSRFRLSARLPG